MKDRIILITGGTGSFGQAMVEYALAQEAKKVIVFSRDEQKQDQMARRWPVGDFPIRYLLGDVRDLNRLRSVLQGVEWVFHAAAMKIIPSCEYNPWETIHTNVIGSWNVIQACMENRVERAILVSSDKAVEPINIYGGSKFDAERLFVHGNVHNKTTFAATRYGNVMGSKGSVIPLFEARAAVGRPLPITDVRMTRFWITMPSAIRFVAASLRRAQGGEVFVPKLKACRVVDLATAVAPNAKHELVGVRPGEKLHEILISPNERAVVNMGAYYVVLPETFPQKALRDWQEGKLRAPEGFSYSSETAPRLSYEDLRAML
jgi:UDP-N-acetylglucosamine 4,6-dehydratase